MVSQGKEYPSIIQELCDTKSNPERPPSNKTLRVHKLLIWTEYLDGVHIHWGKVMGKWNITKPQEKKLPPTTLYNQPHLLKIPSHESVRA